MRAKYIFAEVLTGLWRNITMTVAMMITMVVSLFMLGGSLVLYLQVNDMKDYYYSQVEVSVYLKNDVTPEQRDAINKKLSDDPVVKGVTYEDKKTAYENFQRLFHDAPAMVESVTAEQMPESFRVSLKDPTQFGTIDNNYKDQAGVESIVDQQQLLSKVFDVLGAVQTAALGLAGFMGLAALFLVGNTIQVAAYSKRREVAVMKLVGASNWFIQIPFVLEAVFAAVIGALFAGVFLVLGKIFVLDGSLSALTNVLTPVGWGRILLMFPILAAIGGAFSAATAWMTLRFYVRV